MAAGDARFFDRHSLIALLIAACIVLPRTYLIARAHSDYWDDQWHLIRGLAFLRGEKLNLQFNDPPLAEGLIALPMLVMGCRPDPSFPQSFPGGAIRSDRFSVLYNQP